MDETQREARLEEFIQPVIERWQDPVLTASLSTFTGFCELLGLSNLQSYLLSRRVNEIEDWAATPLDEGGKALKSAIEAAQNVSCAVDHLCTLAKGYRMYLYVLQRHSLESAWRGPSQVLWLQMSRRTSGPSTCL